MRCSYCRSMTHEENCPKELVDRILPVYSAIHKLAMVENRAQGKQAPLYAMPEARALLEQILPMMKALAPVEKPVPKTNATKKPL